MNSKVLRYGFYALLVLGVIVAVGGIGFQMLDTAAAATRIGAGWLAGLCCLVPIVLGGIALANESQ